MNKHIILLSLLILMSHVLFGDPPRVMAASGQKVIQDPNTKVIYYLESDLRHIAALSPDGKVPWRCEVADHTPVGESGYLVGNFWMVRYGFGENGNQVMAQLNPLDPLAKLAGYNTYRVCDLYAWGIGQAKAGLPMLEFYWPVKKEIRP